MLKRLRRSRSSDETEHQETVNNRLRGLASVSDAVAGQSPDLVRRRLQGGRSSLSHRPAPSLDAPG